MPSVRLDFMADFRIRMYGLNFKSRTPTACAVDSVEATAAAAAAWTQLIACAYSYKNI
jgi:hypothetical protein